MPFCKFYRQRQFTMLTPVKNNSNFNNTNDRFPVFLLCYLFLLFFNFVHAKNLNLADKIFVSLSSTKTGWSTCY